MDWLFDNIGKFIPLIIGAIYFLGSLKKGVEDEGAEQDPDAQERARRIQEEIRRKILERQGGSPPSASPVDSESSGPPPLVTRQELEYDPNVPDYAQQERRQAPVYPDPYEEPTVEELFAAPSQQDLYEEQRREIERKMEEARELKKSLALKGKLKKKAELQRSSARRQGIDANTSIRGSLQNSRSVRQAIILKEILGEPVALRGNS